MTDMTTTENTTVEAPAVTITSLVEGICTKVFNKLTDLLLAGDAFAATVVEVLKGEDFSDYYNLSSELSDLDMDDYIDVDQKISDALDNMDWSEHIDVSSELSDMDMNEYIDADAVISASTNINEMLDPSSFCEEGVSTLADRLREHLSTPSFDNLDVSDLPTSMLEELGSRLQQHMTAPGPDLSNFDAVHLGELAKLVAPHVGERLAIMEKLVAELVQANANRVCTVSGKTHHQRLFDLEDGGHTAAVNARLVAIEAQATKLFDDSLITLNGLRSVRAYMVAQGHAATVAAENLSIST